MDFSLAFYIPIYVFIIASGVYYAWRTVNTLKESGDKNLFTVFLSENCDPKFKSTVIKSLVLDAAKSLNLVQMSLLYAAIKIGGAGALFWFLIASLLCKKIMGIWSALWNYFTPDQTNQNRYLSCFSEKVIRELGDFKTFRFWQGVLLFLECMTLFLNVNPYCFAIISFQMYQVNFGNAMALFGSLFLASILLGSKIKWRERFHMSLFFIFVFSGFFCLVQNLLYLLPVLKIIILDAFNGSAFFIGIVGHGICEVIKAGVNLNNFFFVSQSEAPLEIKKEDFSHPIFYAIYTQIKSSVCIFLQIFSGYIMVIWIVSGGFSSKHFESLFFIFFFISSYFSILAMHNYYLAWMEKISKNIHEILKKFLSIVFSMTASFILLILKCPWMNVYHFVCFISSIHMMGYLLMILVDSNRYFILLSDYRDKYLFHCTPYPKIFIHNKEKY